MSENESLNIKNVSSRMPEKYVSELESFENILVNVRSKFVAEWREVENSEASVIQDHVKSMNCCEAMISTIKEKLVQLEEKDTNKRKACEEAEHEMEKMKTQLDKLKEETDVLLREKEMMDDKVSQLHKENKKREEAVSTYKKSIEESSVELEKSVAFFIDKLGMRFKKISGGRIQVLFTGIDPKNPSSPCHFCVKITSDRKYEVTDCEPVVADLQSLVGKLNVTNNLRSFIIEIRKRFKLAS